jgi:hypothetical protein
MRLRHPNAAYAVPRKVACAIVASMFALSLGASAAMAETTLVMTGVYAAASDQLGVDFLMPSGMGRMFMQSYGSAGGVAPDYYAGMPPGVLIGTGGIDSVIRLFDASNTQIGEDDDHDGTLDSFLAAGVIFFAPPGYTQIPALGPGSYRLRQDVFGSNLNNGSFALTAVSVSDFGSIGSYSIQGFSPTAGVNIQNFYFGQKPSTATEPARLIFDSPSDALNVSSAMFLYGNLELTLSAGSIRSDYLEQRTGTANATFGGTSLITLNGGNLTSVGNQKWGLEAGGKTVINHSAGNNVVGSILFLADANNADVTYNLSGTGNIRALSLVVGEVPSLTLHSRFIQSGGTADFGIVSIGSGLASTGTHFYRHTGGTAQINELNIVNGYFDLAGGTLILPAPGVIRVRTGGQFNWLSGTVQFANFSLDSSAAPYFGPTLSLTPGKTLEVLGAMTNNSVLTLDGGRLIAPKLAGPGAYVLNSGELRVTGAGGLTVGNAGPLGKVLTIKPDFLLNVSAGLVIDGAASLTIQDGGRLQAATITNSVGGSIQLAGASARIEGAGTINNAGVLSGSGVVRPSLSNLSGGEVSASTAEILRFTGAAAHSNQGLVRLAGGELLFSGTLTNSASGDIEGRGVLRTGGLTNQGDFTLSSGVTDVHGDLVNAPGGRAIISGNADVTFWDDVQNNGALFKVADGASATFFGAYGGAGVTGAGDVYFEADVTPGSSPALAAFDGNVGLGAASRLAIELGGTMLGSQYDSIAVAGELSLAGTLDVSLFNGFTPSAGQSFNILDWGSLVGTFSSINLPSLPGLIWNTSQLYATGMLSVASPFTADFDEDGDVDGNDLANWKAGFIANAATHTQGDADGDADVDGADFLAWQRQLGSGAAAASMVNPVPEPSAAVLGLIMARLLLCRSRHSCRRPAIDAPRLN